MKISNLKSFIIVLALLLSACGGKHISDTQGDGNPEAAAVDTLAMLRQIGCPYVNGNRPDSTTYAAMLRLPDIRRRGIPEHIDMIGPTSLITEDRSGIYNLAGDDIETGRRRFLEIAWAVDSSEYLSADPGKSVGAPQGEPCHIRIWYEIRPDTLAPVDTLYYHDGIEF